MCAIRRRSQGRTFGYLLSLRPPLVAFVLESCLFVCVRVSVCRFLVLFLVLRVSFVVNLPLALGCDILCE